MRKELFFNIAERLNTITDENGQPVIKHFDLWNENVGFIEQGASTMPAVFIEFAPIDWATLPHGIQEATVTVKLHVVTACNVPASTGSPYQQLPFEHFDLIDRINAALYCFSGDNFNSFTRTASTTDHKYEGFLDNLEVYTTYVFDHSASKK